MKTPWITLLSLFTLFPLTAADVWIEAESFTRKGGWSVDQQFMDQMGSPYLLAHGMGSPVKDARTTIDIPKAGTYTIYVRTYNWTAPWCKKPGPGSFQLSVNGKKMPNTLGTEGSQWIWQKAGQILLNGTKTEVELHDLTGFDGRIDALYLTTSNTPPPTSFKQLQTFRKIKAKTEKPDNESFDLVIVGGGIAGMCTAVSSARLGLNVALINDRPVWGGNNSSEIRVHLGGFLNIGKYPNLGTMVREFGPTEGGNAQPAHFYEDNKKQSWLDAETNIKQYLSFRVDQVKMSSKKTIASVKATHIESGKEIIFSAPLFVDCTGDGTVGYLAGADFATGCESFDTYKESQAPKIYEKRTMGSSVQWYTKVEKSPTQFPMFDYGMNFNDQSCQKTTMGEWTWETGMTYDQINDFERIRDYGLMVVYSNWAYLKNQLKDNSEYSNRSLDWVAYIAGKRESRRLLGDLILTENDLVKRVEYPDATAATSWTIDLHYPDPNNTKYFPGEEFLSIAKHIPIHFYDIPYRTLYSRNISNLMMAGRNISVSHVALGTVRVMRTLGMLGEVVGMAASICNKHGIIPRQLYPNYFNELDALMTKGLGDTSAPKNQHYNEGQTLSTTNK